MNETILAIDAGNTSIHWGYMKDGNLVGEYHRNKHTELSLLPWEEVKKSNCPVVIAGALLHINEEIKRITKEHGIKFIELDTNKQKIIKNTYPTLGIDRVCNLIGAINSFKTLDSSVVVFDFGTATTMTACDKDHNFLGGMIHTGCEIELKAIASKTLSLPHVQLAKEQKITKLNPLSNSTEDAILHGVIIGQIAMVESYLKLFKEETKAEPKVVFTGGNSDIISRFLKKPDLYDQHLTIKGIYHCYKVSYARV